MSKLRVNDPPIEPYAMVTKSRWEVKAKKPLRRSSDEGLKRGRRLRHDDSCNLVYYSSSLLCPSSHMRYFSSSRQITERWGRESNPWSESDELWISRENCKVRWWMMNFEFVQKPWFFAQSFDLWMKSFWLWLGVQSEILRENWIGRVKNVIWEKEESMESSMMQWCSNTQSPFCSTLCFGYPSSTQFCYKSVRRSYCYRLVWMPILNSVTFGIP